MKVRQVALDRSTDWLGLAGASALIAVAVALGGCSLPGHESADRTDSTGVVVGSLHYEFTHGFNVNPSYGSVVYLMPTTRSTEDWWMGLAAGAESLVEPSSEKSLGYADRTTCDEHGAFQFTGARPGEYYLYARVFLITPGEVGRDPRRPGNAGPADVVGMALLNTASVAAGDTTRVVLRSPRSVFRNGPPARRFGPHLSDPSLPRFGEYIHVDELPEAIRRIPPIYPAPARSAGVEGIVLVMALVGKDGLVKDTRVEESIPLLDAAAEAAVAQWIFKPAIADKKPIATWTSVPVRFDL